MNREEFIKEIKELGINAKDESIAKLKIYLDFLKEYNSHTNLTAITEDNDIYLKHFYDSLTITKAVDLNNIDNLIDIGSGAGFPGMILKIFYPHIDVTLLDSNNKKTKFLSELAQQLNINVTIVNDRVENYALTHLNSYDLVTSRAVANLRILSEIGLPLVKKDGLFIALKGNIDAELKESEDTIRLMGGKIINIINFTLYNNEGNRNIIVIKKEKETERKELRTYDKIIKKPLQKTHN